MSVPLLVVLLACRAPTGDPPSTPPPASSGAPSTDTPSATPSDAALPGQARVGAEATELPPGLVCPPDKRGNEGCFRAFLGGTILLGAQATDASSPGYDPAARPEEGPPRPVTIAPFWLQNAEVSVAKLALCVTDGACDPADRDTPGATAKAGDLPTTGISWAGAGRYCAWLGGRLPTEAEWELAARGTTGRRFPWGEDPRCPARQPDDVREQGADVASVAHVCDPVLATLRAARTEPELAPLLGRVRGSLTTSDLADACVALAGADVATIERTLRARVADHQPKGSPQCLYDGPSRLSDLRDGTPEKVYGLAGNVSEWTSDAWATDQRVIRGGSWTIEDPIALRAATRAGLPETARLPDVGFRCAWSPR